MEFLGQQRLPSFWETTESVSTFKWSREGILCVGTKTEIIILIPIFGQSCIFDSCWIKVIQKETKIERLSNTEMINWLEESPQDRDIFVQDCDWSPSNLVTPSYLAGLFSNGSVYIFDMNHLVSSISIHEFQLNLKGVGIKIELEKKGIWMIRWCSGILEINCKSTLLIACATKNEIIFHSIYLEDLSNEAFENFKPVFQADTLITCLDFFPSKMVKHQASLIIGNSIGEICGYSILFSRSLESYLLFSFRPFESPVTLLACDPLHHISVCATSHEIYYFNFQSCDPSVPLPERLPCSHSGALTALQLRSSPSSLCLLSSSFDGHVCLTDFNLGSPQKQSYAPRSLLQAEAAVLALALDPLGLALALLVQIPPVVTNSREVQSNQSLRQTRCGLRIACLPLLSSSLASLADLPHIFGQCIPSNLALSFAAFPLLVLSIFDVLDSFSKQSSSQWDLERLQDQDEIEEPQRSPPMENPLRTLFEGLKISREDLTLQILESFDETLSHSLNLSDLDLLDSNISTLQATHMVHHSIRRLLGMPLTSSPSNAIKKKISFLKLIQGLRRSFGPTQDKAIILLNHCEINGPLRTLYELCQLPTVVEKHNLVEHCPFCDTGSVPFNPELALNGKAKCDSCQLIFDRVFGTFEIAPLDCFNCHICCTILSTDQLYCMFCQIRVP